MRFNTEFLHNEDGSREVIVTVATEPKRARRLEGIPIQGYAGTLRDPSADDAARYRMALEAIIAARRVHPNADSMAAIAESALLPRVTASAADFAGTFNLG